MIGPAELISRTTYIGEIKCVTECPGTDPAGYM